MFKRAVVAAAGAVSKGSKPKAAGKSGVVAKKTAGENMVAKKVVATKALATKKAAASKTAAGQVEATVVPEVSLAAVTA